MVLEIVTDRIAIVVEKKVTVRNTYHNHPENSISLLFHNMYCKVCLLNYNNKNL